MLFGAAPWTLEVSYLVVPSWCWQMIWRMWSNWHPITVPTIFFSSLYNNTMMNYNIFNKMQHRNSNPNGMCHIQTIVFNFQHEIKIMLPSMIIFFFYFTRNFTENRTSFSNSKLHPSSKCVAWSSMIRVREQAKHDASSVCHAFMCGNSSSPVARY